MKSNLGIVATIFLGMITIGPISEAIAADKKITKKDVPAVVLKAFEDSYPKAKVNAYLIEMEKGEKCYELETIDGSLKRDLLYRADGSVAEVEEILTPKTVPESIAKAILMDMPKAKIIRGEKNTRDTTVFFEVLVFDGKEKVRVFLNPDGKIQKKSAMKSEKEEEKGLGK